jgi:hypothetical protein
MSWLSRWSGRIAIVTGLLVLPTACGSGKSPPPPPTCGERCQDGVAARGLRELLKLAYNTELQGKPVGKQDATAQCALAGEAHIVGTATSNAEQGSTFLDLTFNLTACTYLQRRAEPSETYSLRFDGVIHESGTLAVQPSSTTALLFESEAISIVGTVYDPALEFAVDACALDLAQSGNNLAGTLCERELGVSL